MRRSILVRHSGVICLARLLPPRSLAPMSHFDTALSLSLRMMWFVIGFFFKPPAKNRI